MGNIIELEETRTKIQKIDDQLTQLFIKRMELAKDVAEYKQAMGMAVLDEEKERQKMSDIAAAMPEEFQEYAKRLYSVIFEMSRDYQTRIIGEKE